jgi:hypothetical protein
MEDNTKRCEKDKQIWREILQDGKASICALCHGTESDG